MGEYSEYHQNKTPFLLPNDVMFFTAFIVISMLGLVGYYMYFYQNLTYRFKALIKTKLLVLKLLQKDNVFMSYQLLDLKT